MEMDRFKNMVARLQQESAHTPRQYRAKVAMLALLGFAILALVIATVAFGLVALAGFVVAMAFTGGRRTSAFVEAWQTAVSFGDSAVVHVKVCRTGIVHQVACAGRT